MEVVEAAVQRLVEGARPSLYDRYDVLPGEESLETMNMSHRPAAVRRYPDDLLDASVSTDAAIRPGDIVRLLDMRAVERGGRIFASPLEDPRVQVELIVQGAQCERIAALMGNGAVFDVHGRVRSTRARLHRDRLEKGGTELRFEQRVRGDGAEVGDPFPMLRRVLTERLRRRVVAIAHGDLHARNVLLVEDLPCLIDYADTRPGQPLFLDFARLEGSLVRGALSDLSWSDQVWLQRLLAAAGTGGGRPDLPNGPLRSAFGLLWAIRRAARSVQPPASCLGGHTRHRHGRPQSRGALADPLQRQVRVQEQLDEVLAPPRLALGHSPRLDP
jgi:Ternary complex associated domain 9